MSQNEGFWTTLIRTVSAVLELRLKMPDPKRTLRVLIPIALLVLLLGSTLGAVWHHHAILDAERSYRVIQLGYRQNGQRQILKGISVGDRVVGDGSLVLQFANSLQH